MKKILSFVLLFNLLFANLCAQKESYGFLLNIAEAFIGKKVCINDILNGLKKPQEQLPQTGILGDLLSKLCLENFKAFDKNNQVGASGELEYGGTKIPVTFILLPIGKSEDYFNFEFIFREGDTDLTDLSPVFEHLKKLFIFRNISITLIRKHPEDALAGVIQDEKAPYIKIESDVQFRGLNDVIKDWFKLEVIIPQEASSADAVQVNLIDTQKEATKICLQELFSSHDKKIDPKMLQKTFGSFCLEKEVVQFQATKDGLALAIKGKIFVFGKKAQGALYIKTSKEGKPCILLQTQISDNFELDQISEHFSFCDKILIFKNSLITLSTCTEAPEIEGLEGAPAGFTITSEIDFKGFLAKFFGNFDLSTAQASISIPPDPSNIKQFSIEIKKTLDKPKSYGPVKLKEFDFFIQGGIPSPAFGITIAADLVTKSEDISFVLTGDMGPTKFDLQGQAQCKTGNTGAQICPVINEPFGFPLVLTDPSLTIHIFEGALAGLGMGGKLKMGESDLFVDGDIDIVEPLDSKFIAKTNHFCLSDLADLWLNLANRAGQAIKLPPLNVPGIGCFNETEISFSFIYKIPKVLIKTNFDLLGVQAHVLGELTITGLSLQGNLDPITSPIFFMTDTNNLQKGPQINLQLNLSDQSFYLDGKISLLNGLISKEQQIDISKDGFTFEISQTLFGFEIDLKLTLPFGKSVKNWAVEGDFTSGIQDLIIKEVTEKTEDLNKNIQEIKNKIIMDQDKCNGLPKVLKETCLVTLSTLNESLKLAEEADTPINKNLKRVVGSFGIKSAHFSTSLMQLSEGILPSVKVEFFFLGNTDTVKLENFNIKQPAQSISKLVNMILKQIIPKKLVKNLGKKIEVLGKKVSKEAKNVGGKIGDAGEKTGKETKEIGKQTVKQAKDLGKKAKEKFKKFFHKKRRK